MKTGSCHCGAVRFTVEGAPEQAVECNCSHCRRNGFLLWFVPRAALEVYAGEDRLSAYTSNRHVIQNASAPPAAARRSVWAGRPTARRWRRSTPAASTTSTR